jgi:hypothetical protein
MMRGMMKIIGWCAALFATLIIVLWLTGRIASDRWYWSQWLLWIPTPAALCATLLGLAAAARPAGKTRTKRSRALRWGAVAGLVLVYFLFIEHRFLRSAPPIPRAESSITLMHWNMAPPTNDDQAVGWDFIVQTNPDIAVVTSPGAWRPQEPLDSWVGPNGNQVQAGQLLLLTRFPLIRHRLLVSNEGIQIVLAEIDVRGDRLTLYMVDLPSSPKRPRMQIARRARELLDQANQFGGGAPAQPDVVVGDFNLTRDSTSLATLFPGMPHAFNEAGHGYGASFHRSFPLYHIDQMLLGRDVECLRYDLLATPVGRHKAQVGWLRRRDRY